MPEFTCQAIPATYDLATVNYSHADTIGDAQMDKGIWGHAANQPHLGQCTGLCRVLNLYRKAGLLPKFPRNVQHFPSKRRRFDYQSRVTLDNAGDDQTDSLAIRMGVVGVQ